MEEEKNLIEEKIEQWAEISYFTPKNTSNLSTSFKCYHDEETFKLDSKSIFKISKFKTNYHMDWLTEDKAILTREGSKINKITFFFFLNMFNFYTIVKIYHKKFIFKNKKNFVF